MVASGNGQNASMKLFVNALRALETRTGAVKEFFAPLGARSDFDPDGPIGALGESPAGATFATAH